MSEIGFVGKGTQDTGSDSLLYSCADVSPCGYQVGPFKNVKALGQLGLRVSTPNGVNKLSEIVGVELPILPPSGYFRQLAIYLF